MANIDRPCSLIACHVYFICHYQYYNAEISVSVSNPLYTGGLFDCYMLYESICYLGGVGYVLSLLFYF